jgi:hypothetical protein
MIHITKRKVKSFILTASFTKIWLLPVWILLWISRILIIVVPFKKIASTLGTYNGNTVFIPLLTPLERKRALLISRTVRMAARYLPWVANCFAQVIVASLLMKFYNIPYSLFFGLRKPSNLLENKAMYAHAWITSGGVSITGGYGFNDYTVVATFYTRSLLTNE